MFRRKMVTTPSLHKYSIFDLLHILNTPFFGSKNCMRNKSIAVLELYRVSYYWRFWILAKNHSPNDKEKVWGYEPNVTSVLPHLVWDFNFQKHTSSHFSSLFLKHSSPRLIECIVIHSVFHVKLPPYKNTFPNFFKVGKIGIWIQNAFSGTATNVSSDINTAPILSF